ncbi:MAG: PEFG-CTERM sorting domain-containing protein, partial [Nitrosarchaeum sp.]|nr:PEFG-CTERM sorting domain-containing protein [Nitrosarchaeum sp.]
GSISLEIPREIIDAKNQDDDEKFIVIIDGIQVPYQETISDSNSRLITINFETGDSYIEVIGTSVIPEFGSIAVMILAAAIMSTVLITRNKFNRHI